MKRILCFAILISFASSLQAGVLFFTDEAAFNAATAGMTFGLEDFSSSTPTLLANNTDHAFNGFTARSTDNSVSNTAFYVSPDDFAGSQHAPFTSSQHLGWGEDAFTSAFSFNGFGDGPQVTLNFNDALSAVSFQFLDSDFTDEYSLSVDGIGVPSFPSSADSTFDGVTFFGIVNTMGTFSQLRFDLLNTGGFTEEFGIDDIRYSAANSGVVPEPTSFATWGLLVGAVAAVRRRRK